MTGSVEKRGENSWRLVVSSGTKGGKQVKHTRSIHCKSEPEARKLLAEFYVEVEQGLVVDGKKMTFKDFVERWLKDYAKVNLAPKTLFRYKEILYSRVLPAMGHLRIDQIKPTHIIEFENNLREDGIRLDGKPGTLSEKTILYHHRIISSILNDAVQWQVIRSNPTSRVKPPKVKRVPAACYDEMQVAALLQALEQVPLKYRVMVELALATGLRRGELMGLEWKDIDIDKATLDVRQASQYLPGKGVFTKEPKNETSKRLIAVPVSTITLLRRYKKEQAAERLQAGDLWRAGEKMQEVSWIFTAWDGKRMYPDTISKWFSAFLKGHSLPHIPFHGLRHTSATLMIGEGVDLKEVSSRLGHADIATTGNIYAHFLKSVDKDAASKMDDLLDRCRKQRSS